MNRKTFKKSFFRLLSGLCLLVILVLASCATSRDSLAAVRSRGVLLVGATGDYRPMSYLEPETGKYVGFDTELAEDLAAELGVRLEFVPTTWPTLMDDTLAGKFDLAVCGITITSARKRQNGPVPRRRRGQVHQSGGDRPPGGPRDGESRRTQ